MAQIKLSGVTKQFGSTQVICGVDISIEDREFVVILGPSGCGKSTLLRMIAGLEDISTGEISINDRRVDHLPPKDRGCAMVFQNYALYPHMSVRGNIGYGLRIARMPKPEREKRIAETAKLLDLSELLNRKPSQLSGGQRQRVAIGRALAREPEVFLFDEPLSNLDAKLRTSTRVELRKLHDRLGATTIYVTHDQVEAMTLADRIVIINGGVIEQIGTPKEIYDAPVTSFVAGFIGSPQTNLIKVEMGEAGDRFSEAGGTQFVFPEVLLLGGIPTNEAILGIRPEEIEIGGNTVAVVVEVVEELGSHRLLYCRCGTSLITVVDDSDDIKVSGDCISLGLPPSKVHLFDAENGHILNHPKNRGASNESS
jgi:sn-glycerol 3-phosphate transport system ATP-binding protein